MTPLIYLLALLTLALYVFDPLKKFDRRWVKRALHSLGWYRFKLKRVAKRADKVFSPSTYRKPTPSLLSETELPYLEIEK